VAIRVVPAVVAVREAARLAAILLAALAMAACDGSDSGGPAAASSPPISTSVPPTSGNGSESLTVTASTSSSESVVGPAHAQPQGLDTIVDSKACGNFGWGNRAPARIAGVDYPKSLPVACFNNGDVASADFLVPSGARLLTGAVGIEDHTTNTDAKAKCFVLNAVTGKPLFESNSLAYGQPATRLSASVEGVTRIRLQVEFSEAHSGLITASWASMMFTF
jgi:NPCBM/NEW2 domain